ncbi:LysR family transcriptional regulator [Prauserella rugosa]|uniref:DNA-binding transcriptional LysR family regulator n=1 Tax=Prauserella rugosa TaxID=43354 RepID=A0A660CNH3_9PSEU|nr:LysR family transcriptional regulator [Prauserella rugosa]KID30897.1 transcriptional regulator [Prauserella sp. Am3]TWH22675.1 DNA-binding transcriptional LysR family regulator [Prauserella rugosa]
MHHLRYFLAVARELNFTRAARSLNMSVPPLSQRIRDLERELGEPLFDRSTHHTRLSAAGEALLPLAESVVADFDAIPGLISSRDQRCDVRLAVPDVLNPTHRRNLSASIRSLEERFRFTIRQLPSLEMESALLSHSLDLAISHVGTSDDRLATVVLYREPLGAVVDASHFPGRTSLTLADLRGFTYIQGPRHWDLGSHRADRLAAQGVVVDKDAQFTDTSGLLVFLRSTKGFSLAPVESATALALDPECTVLPVEDLGATLTTYLVWRAADARFEPVVQVLRRARD